MFLNENLPKCIRKGKNSTISLRTSIFAYTYIGAPRKINSEQVIIDKNVFIFLHCFILLNVVLGDEATINRGNMVTRNVPPNTLFGMPSPKPLDNLIALTKIRA